MAVQSLIFEDVVVAAQKPRRGLNDVLIAISVIDAELIQHRNLLTIAQVNRYALNDSVTEQALEFKVVSMSGFLGGANRSFKKSVGR